MNKYDIYLNEFRNAITKHNHSISLKDRQGYVKKISFLGVKTTVTRPKSEESIAKASNNLELTKTILMSLAKLKPIEFIIMFPVGAGYDNEEYKVNDYLDVIHFINSLDPLIPIGENIHKVLWQYKNLDITLFNIKLISYSDDIRTSKGQPRVIEEFLRLDYIKNKKKSIKRDYPTYLREVK